MATCEVVNDRVGGCGTVLFDRLRLLPELLSVKTRMPVLLVQEAVLGIEVRTSTEISLTRSPKSIVSMTQRPLPAAQDLFGRGGEPPDAQVASEHHYRHIHGTEAVY
jgi:hypothetical protein